MGGKKQDHPFAVAAGTQDAVIAFLSRPEAYGEGVRRVEKKETHVSVVFLAGARAFKLKRAVTFPYLDFSTLAKRRAACEAEVAINRRTAPDIYLGVVPVTRSADGTLALGGEGEPVEWLVAMKRFDEATLFDRLARAGALNRALMEDLAAVIARFHEQAERRPKGGGRRGVAAIIENNAESFALSAEGVLDRAKVSALNEGSRARLAALGGLLDERREAGFQRLCHGDLHLRNIFLLDGKPTLFDAIEFNEAFAVIDVLYDLAFLLMDLDHRDLRRLANIVFNRYLAITGDVGGLALLPLFLSLRAAVRSHVDAAAAARVSDPDEGGRIGDEARAYLDLALAYLAPPPPRLVAVGGLSGSGKSRLARELAPYLGAAPGALVARSDIIRKRLAGVDFLSRLGPEGYTKEMTERTYRAVYDQVRAALRAGHGAIADAVFARPEQRRAVEKVAADEGVPFLGLWLEAPADVMERRVRKRRADASDATAEVLRMQLGYEIGPIGWAVIDSSGSKGETLRRALALLGR